MEATGKPVKGLSRGFLLIEIHCKGGGFYENE